MFLAEGKIFIFGREPVRIDVVTAPSDVDFEQSYARRKEVNWDGVIVPLISFEDLKRNKAASGRAKDLADLENLPDKGQRTRIPTPEGRGRKKSGLRTKPTKRRTRK